VNYSQHQRAGIGSRTTSLRACVAGCGGSYRGVLRLPSRIETEAANRKGASNSGAGLRSPPVAFRGLTE
jgi:hypothetical protein